MSKDKKETLICAIALALVSLACGTSYAVVKDALNTLPPMTLMTLRFSFSTIILSLVFIKRLKGLDKKTIHGGSIIGLFLFLSFLTLVIGALYTTASKQAFLIGTYVLTVPFLVWVISKKTPGIHTAFGALLATVGIAFLTLDGSMQLNKGDLISLLCGVFFACHIIAIEHFAKDSDPVALTIIQFTVTSILFILFMGLFESYHFILTKKAVLSVTYLVLVATVLALTVQNIVQKYLSSATTSLVMALDSAFGSIFAVFFLNETMTIKMILGCIAIFLGIITQETRWDFIRKRVGQRKSYSEEA